MPLAKMAKANELLKESTDEFLCAHAKGMANLQALTATERYNQLDVAIKQESQALEECRRGIALRRQAMSEFWKD